MSDLTPRIRRVTEDLKFIQEQLFNAANTGVGDPEREKVLNTLLEEHLLFDFKSSVDHMRHLLWSYIEAESKKGTVDLKETLQAVRIQRVTEMLRVLAPSVDEAAMGTHPEAQSFFEIIHEIANATMDKQMKEK